MNEKCYGLFIEGFVGASYSRMFNTPFDARNHPLTYWSQATVSERQDNFDQTKDNVLRTLDGLTHTLYRAGQDELLIELSPFRKRLENSTNVIEMATAIEDASPILDRAYAQPTTHNI